MLSVKAQTRVENLFQWNGYIHQINIFPSFICGKLQIGRVMASSPMSIRSHNCQEHWRIQSLCDVQDSLVSEKVLIKWYSWNFFFKNAELLAISYLRSHLLNYGMDWLPWQVTESGPKIWSSAQAQRLPFGIAKQRLLQPPLFTRQLLEPTKKIDKKKQWEKNVLRPGSKARKRKRPGRLLCNPVQVKKRSWNALEKQNRINNFQRGKHFSLLQQIAWPAQRVSQQLKNQ